MNATFFILPFSALILFASCGNGDEVDGDSATGDTTTMKLNPNSVKAENVFYYIPSPIETADLLKKAGADYDKDLLNPIDNVSKYSSTAARALNLGVYGADLSFTGIFDQSTESMFYMQCASKLAGELRISGAFGENTRDRLEANATNRDSILSIITDSYWDCDAILKQNGQQHTSALMITGGWLEGLYLACKVAETTKNAELRKRIGEQKLSLDNLVALLESKKEDKDVAEILVEIKSLKAIFDKLPNVDGQTSVKTNEKEKTTEIGEDNAAGAMTDQQFTEIFNKVNTLRNNIISRT
ncbi:MAG: hypothetical protein FD123_1885 [Bacteroidetes bacterium]|nr:MAG: hypothetical protein FD123_1885 [Bacteroidota bacterium]